MSQGEERAPCPVSFVEPLPGSDHEALGGDRADIDVSGVDLPALPIAVPATRLIRDEAGEIALRSRLR
jgi:hypothetical protein